MAGQSLRDIDKDEDMPSKTQILVWLSIYTEFADQYTRAHQIQAENEMDELKSIADDDTADMQFKEIETEHGKEAKAVFLRAAVERSKLRIETRKWRIERLHPKKYGPKQDVTHTHHVEPFILQNEAGKDLITLGAKVANPAP